MTRPFGVHRARSRAIALRRRHRRGSCAGGRRSPPSRHPPNRRVTRTLAADPPAHVSFVDGAAVLERDGQPRLARRTCRCSPATACERRADASRSCLPTAARCTSTPTPRGLPVGRARAAARRTDPAVDPGTGSRRVVPRRCPVGVGADHAARRIPVAVAARRPRGEKSSWRSFAAPRSSSTTTAGRRSAPASARSARASAAPSYAYVFNSASWDELRSLVGSPAR